MGSGVDDLEELFVLVSGRPGSGKTTLATALASELRLPLLAKDTIKEVLADQLGVPTTIQDSHQLGRTAVVAMLQIARSCPAAVLDSTWFDYTQPLLAALPGVLIEVHCELPLEVARARYHARADLRHGAHLDRLRSDSELWAPPERPVGVGHIVVVDTQGPLNARDVAQQVRRAAHVVSDGSVPVRVPRFIHLNGPPGIGKSTLARLYAENHPGVLNLDIDQVRGMIGGWQDQFQETGEIARPIAFGMAGTHLASGRDVVMPQYLGRPSEIARFEKVAADSGAAFVEIILMDTKERSIQRFTSRGKDDTLGWHQQARDIVERTGGAALLAGMYDQLEEVIRARTNSTVVPSVAEDVGQTYQAVEAVLSDQMGSTGG